MVGIIALQLWLITGFASSVLFAQVIGEEAEMDRLQAKAEEAITNGDPDGASMNMGKAALMASQLAKKQEDRGKTLWFHGAEALFRSQEHGYRALALFERAGGQTPASTGVCGSMRLAKQHLEKAVNLLVDAPPMGSRSSRLQAVVFEWLKTLDGLNADFQCH